MGLGHKNHALAGIFAVVALTACVAGCGGGSTATSSLSTAGTSTTASSAISKSAFIKQADSICAEANSAISSLPPASAGAAGNVTVSQQLEVAKGELQSLKSLGKPDSGGPQLNRFLAALDGQVTALEQESKTLQNGGDSSIATTAVDSATTSAQAAARAFGLKACAGSVAPSGTPTANGTTAGTGGTATTATPTPTTATPATPTPAPTPAPAPAPAPPAGGGTGLPTGGTGGSGGSGGGSGGVGVGP